MSNNSTDVNSTESNSSNWRQFDYEMIAPSFGYLIILIFGSFGTLSQLGNGMTIASTLWFDSLRRNPTYLVIMNQAVGDLLASLLVPASWIFVQFEGAQFLLDLDFLCKGVASSNFVFSAVSLISMSLLALNRLLAIVHSSSFKRWFTINKTVIYCIATWIAAFLLDAISFTDFGGRIYDPNMRSCFFEREKQSYVILMVTCCIGLPCLVIVACYVRIFFFVRESKTRVQSNCQKELLTLAKSLFVIFFGYCMCWLPVGTVFLIDYLIALPSWMFLYSRLLAYANSAINPLVYSLTNLSLREAYKFSLQKLSCSLVFKHLQANRLESRREPHAIFS
nr:G protein-coupled receptor [Proales similis]